MSKHLWVDPPSGWQYGFPKIWNGEGDITDWLVDNGYPIQKIEQLGEYFYCRHWVPTEEEIKQNGELHNG